MISPATIALVKERADLHSLVREAGVSLRKAGISHVGLCPFHNEKTPSFTVHAARSFFYCHGCKEHGGPIDFVMKNEGLTFPEAVRALAERCGVDIEEDVQWDRGEVERARREATDLHAVNALAAAFYTSSLWGGLFDPARGAPLARAELNHRGLAGAPGDESPVGGALGAFRIGYAPSSWRGLARFLEREGVSLKTAERAGLLVEKNGRHYDRFRHRLMFPVVDHLGRVVGFSGRILPEPAEHHRESPDFTVGEKPAKYTNTPETPIYTKGSALFGLWQAKEAIRERGEALLVEGNFDVLALHARGMKNVVAPLGTAFTEVQARLLRRFTSSLVLAFDADAAGRKATWTARLPARAARLDVRVAKLPAGADPDSLAQERGVEALADAVGRAQGLREHLIEQLLAEGSDGGLEARAKRVGAVVKLLGEEVDPAMRDLVKVYADRLSSRLVVDGRAPANLRDLELSLRRAMRPRDTEERVVLPVEDAVGFAVVGAVLDVPSVVRFPEVAAVLAGLAGDSAAAARAAQEVSAGDVLALTPHALRPHVEQRLASPVYTTERQAFDAILANRSKVERRGAQAGRAELRRAVVEAEARGDEDEVARLLAELSKAR